MSKNTDIGLDLTKILKKAKDLKNRYFLNITL